MPENIDYDNLKKRGFLKQKQEGFFVFRTRMPQGVYSKEMLEKIAQIAQSYGKGIIHATTRQGLEIPFIKLDDILKIEEEFKLGKIEVGVSGSCLRTITVCPGNNWCKFGLIDTFLFSKRIEDELGMRCGLGLPHKFKINISGCPNSCAHPQSSEIGIHGAFDASSPEKRVGYVVYLGGCGGRSPRAGLKLNKIFSEDEALSIIQKVVNFYKANGKPKQRLALLIEEMGKEKFLNDLNLGV